jgi:hypothetical protein
MRPAGCQVFTDGSFVYLSGFSRDNGGGNILA